MGKLVKCTRDGISYNQSLKVMLKQACPDPCEGRSIPTLNLSFQGEQVIKVSTACWLLQFELMVLHHTRWSQLGSAGLYINQSLPQGALHTERTAVPPEWRWGFFHYFFVLNTITIQVKITGTEITPRVVGVLVTTSSPYSPGWIPGFKQQIFISPNNLFSLLHLTGGFQIHAFTGMLSHAG